MSTSPDKHPDAEVLARLELDPSFPYERAKGLRLLASDVDGILTDGGLYYDPSGLSIKRFDCQDGVAFKLAQQSGMVTALISGMESPSVLKRAEYLGIEECVCGPFDKVEVIQGIMDKYSIAWEQVAFVGDDWLDLPVLRRVGLALTVADAQPEVRGLAHYVSPLGGGRGAMRQLMRHILAANGKLEGLLRHWLSK